MTKALAPLRDNLSATLSTADQLVRLISKVAKDRSEDGTLYVFEWDVSELIKLIRRYKTVRTKQVAQGNHNTPQRVDALKPMVEDIIKDGGSILLSTTDGPYWIDHRIGSRKHGCNGVIYRGEYPDTTAVVFPILTAQIKHALGCK